MTEPAILGLFCAVLSILLAFGYLFYKLGYYQGRRDEMLEPRQFEEEKDL